MVFNLRVPLPGTLGLQAALLIAAVVPFDESWATDAARRLVAAGPGARAVRELADLVGGPPGDAHLERLIDHSLVRGSARQPVGAMGVTE